jgi:putative (di)nucleoside polyphosphate hydrolase
MLRYLLEAKPWLFYDVPEQLAQKAWRNPWRGQRQKRFVMLFKGDDAEINVGTDNPEFNAWRCVPVQELAELAVSFKRQLYLNVLAKVSHDFSD